MSEPSQIDPSATAVAVAWWAQRFGVQIEPDRITDMAAYLEDVRLAFHALAHLDLDGAAFPGSFDPTWEESDR